MADRAQDDVTALKEDLAKLREDVAKLGADLRGLAGSGSTMAGRAAAAEGAKLREEVEETVRSLLGRGGKVVEDATAQIEQRPLLSVLLAFAIGFILGRILERR
jgi:ElaB/YqjD/DUF883 family membrane-anchored ribosome-binding protein